MNEAAAQGKALQPGDYAPDFTMDRDGGGTITLSECRGQNVVVYFYPKDDTPGCTTEAIEFTQSILSFENANTVIVGISRDDIDKHDKFKSKHNLGVILGADITGTVCEAYDVWKEKQNYGKTYMGIQRSTFLIDKHGIIKNIWPNVKVKGHVAEVLEAARELG